MDFSLITAGYEAIPEFETFNVIGLLSSDRAVSIIRGREGTVQGERSLAFDG